MKHGGMGRRTPIKVGDWVEWQPNGNWTRELAPYDGATGIVYAIDAPLADVRFPDFTTHRLNLAHLTWLPSRGESRRSAANLWQKHLAELPDPAVAPEGRPHTFTDGPRRAGSVPGNKD